MNGILIKIVVDTNILFMAIYNETGKADKILQLAAKNKIILFTPISVKEELSNVLKREFDWSDEEIENDIEELPIKWIEKELYEPILEMTKVKHKADKPIEATALLLNCGILSADEHFKNIKQKIDIDVLLKQVE